MDNERYIFLKMPNPIALSFRKDILELNINLHLLNGIRIDNIYWL